MFARKLVVWISIRHWMCRFASCGKLGIFRALRQKHLLFLRSCVEDLGWIYIKEIDPEMICREKEVPGPLWMYGHTNLQSGMGRSGQWSLKAFSGVWGELTCMTSVLTALKQKGNEAFVRGDYETAILRYSEGLEKLKDMKVLYTNRAQVSEARLCPRNFPRGRQPLTLWKQRKMRLAGASGVVVNA